MLLRLLLLGSFLTNKTSSRLVTRTILIERDKISQVVAFHSERKLR